MIDKVSLPESHWDRESIRAARMEKLLAANKTREELLELVADLETALYPFVYVLGSLNDKSWRGTMANSKLFPFKSETDCFQVYNDSKIEEQKTIPETDLHDVDYFEEDSIIIEDGSQLNDLFNILAVNQQAAGASVGCGSIVMGDVRYATRVMYPDSQRNNVISSSNTERRNNLVVSTVSWEIGGDLVPSRTLNMDLGWYMSTAARSFMGKHGLTNLAFKYDFALNLSGDTNEKDIG